MYSSSNDEKGRAILLMKTIMKINTGCDESSNNVAIHLISSNINKKFQELEKLKIIISEIRKKKKDLLSSTATVTTTSTGTNISGSSSSSNVNNNKNDDDYNLKKRKLDGTDNQHSKNDEVRKRQYILKNNKYLYKQYNDLVIINKVLNDDDFWLAHEELFIQQEYPSSSSSSSQSSSSSIIKGKQNYFDIHDIIQINNNEITSIDLTLDIKNDLFNNNPWLKRAFQAEVPLRKSEQEFWTLYFEAEYFKILNKNNINNNNNSYNNNNSCYDYTKQLQYRYGDNDDNNNDSNNTSNNNTNNHKKLQNIDSDIDLTSVYNDYHPHEFLDTEDQNNNNTGRSSSYSGNNHQVILKYNQNSMNVIKIDKYLKNVNNNNNNNANSSYEIHELENLHEPTYIPLKHTTTSTTTATTISSSTMNDACSDHKVKGVNNNDYDSVEHSNIQEKLLDSSSLSSSCTKRHNILLYLERQLKIEDDTTNYADINYNSNDDIDDKSNYFNIYHQSKRGDKLFFNLTTKLLKASSSSSSTSLSKLTSNKFNNYDVTSNTVGVEDGIDEEIKQELYEIYTDVTELLRHFYSMLNRCHHDNLNCNHITSSGSSGRSNNSNMNKTEAILNRLLEIRENKLNVKKTNISTHYHTTNINIKNHHDHHRFLSSNERYADKVAVVSGRNIDSNDKKIAMSKVRFEASIAVINGINMLIRRAETTWNEFCTV